jgi:hypothetical protein
MTHVVFFVGEEPGFDMQLRSQAKQTCAALGVTHQRLNVVETRDAPRSLRLGQR